MRDWVRNLLMGAAIWAAPFIVGMMMFAVAQPGTPLFDTAVTLALVAGAIVISLRHLPGLADRSVFKCLSIGAIWALIAIVIDLPIFIFGPEQMRMDPIDYIADIGLSYLLVPMITVGIGFALNRSNPPAPVS